MAEPGFRGGHQPARSKCAAVAGEFAHCEQALGPGQLQAAFRKLVRVRKKEKRRQLVAAGHLALLDYLRDLENGHGVEVLIRNTRINE